jgi:hypothetical protein
LHITPPVAGLFAAGGLVVLAACGSAAYNSAATTNASSATLTLSECMHAHGTKSFPDPTNGPAVRAAAAP